MIFRTYASTARGSRSRSHARYALASEICTRSSALCRSLVSRYAVRNSACCRAATNSLNRASASGFIDRPPSRLLDASSPCHGCIATSHLRTTCRCTRSTHVGEQIGTVSGHAGAVDQRLGRPAVAGDQLAPDQRGAIVLLGLDQQVFVVFEDRIDEGERVLEGGCRF